MVTLLNMIIFVGTQLEWSKIHALIYMLLLTINRTVIDLLPVHLYFKHHYLFEQNHTYVPDQKMEHLAKYQDMSYQNSNHLKPNSPYLHNYQIFH